MKVEPCPGTDHTETSPPWFSQTCLTIAKPKPVPPVDLDLAGSTL